jgi:outer membrane protein TolC
MQTGARLMSLIGVGAAVATIAMAPRAAHGAEALTLRESMVAAIQGSDLLRAEGGRRAAADAAVDAARSFLLPGIAVEERFLRTDNPAYDFSMKINQGAFTGADLAGAPDSFNHPDPISDFQTSLTVTQPLYAPRASVGLAMARGEAAAATLDHARRSEEVAHAAMQAWFASKAAEAFEEAAAKAEDDATEHLRLAKVAEDAGVGLASDRLRASVALSEAKRMRLAVRNNLEIARRGLGLAIGREDAVTPAGDDLGGAPPDLEALLAVVGARTDLQAMTKRVDNARLNIDLAKAERLPEVGVFGSLQANDPDYPLGTSGTSYSAGIGVTWKLSGWHSAAAARQAAGELQRAEAQRSGMEREARYRVREAWLRWGEAKESLAIAGEAEGVAEEGVRLVRLRYENGLATMVALLDAQAALNRARSERAKATADLAGALGEVRFQSGQVLDGVVATAAAGSSGAPAAGVSQ